MHPDAKIDGAFGAVAGPLLALFVGYVAAGALSARLIEVQIAAIFWPPNGVLLAALLVAPRTRWISCLLVAGAAELTWNAFHWYNPLHHALLYYSGNALEVLAAASLILTLQSGPFRLESLREFGVFLLAVVVAPVVSAIVIATTNAALGKSEFDETWRLVWLGDATGLLVATPISLVALDAWRRRASLPRPKPRELALLAAGVAAMLAVVLSAHLPTLYAALPLVLWAAVRFQLRGVAIAIALLATAAAFLTPPPGAGSDGDVAQAMMLPSALGLTAILGVLVATLSLERLRAQRDLERLNVELEARIELRTAELRTRERELEAALQLAADVDRRKDAFLAMLGHELRNPLAPIRNATEWLARATGEHPPVARVLPMMQRQVRQMTRLVDDLLDVARISQDRLHVERVPVAIGEVIEQALEAVQPMFAAREHRVSVVRERAPLYVLGDAGRLAQCIGNLLTNAAKYSDSGSRIELAVQETPEAIEVIVQDFGTGIAADLLPRVFDPFVQGPETIGRADGGLGIGLSLVRRIVELHDGAVGAASDGAGHGSTFTIRLPRAPAPAQPASSAPGSFATSGYFDSKMPRHVAGRSA